LLLKLFNSVCSLMPTKKINQEDAHIPAFIDSVDEWPDDEYSQ